MGNSATVIYVHGNGNKRAKEAEKEAWDRVLFSGDPPVETRMAYYADLRYPSPLTEGFEEEALGIAPSLETLGAETEAPTYDEFVEELLAEAADPVARDALEPLASSMASFAEERAQAEPEEAIGLEVLPVPKWMRKILFRRLVKSFFKDVHDYFFTDRGPLIRQRLQDELADLTGPVVVVAHSLGSIVAYDVLRQAANENLDAKLLLTVGSPLGIKEIQDGITKPLLVPAPVDLLVNLADARDLVALDKTLGDEYDPGAKVSDRRVENNSSATHHSVSGYLSTTDARKEVRNITG